MRLSRRQIAAMKTSDKRINIWTGSVRSGKTVGLYFLFNRYVHFGPRGKYAIVAKTLETLRENILDPMRAIFGDSLTYSDAGRRISLGGHEIRGIGANDEQSKNKIQGTTLAGVMGDEVTLWPESFFTMLMSRLSVQGAQAFFSCNPDSPQHWLKRKWIDRKDELDLSISDFIIDDNPFLDSGYIENIKKEYTGLWYKRYVLGLWAIADGVIYEAFDENKNVQKYDREFTEYAVSVDYGTIHPCVFLLVGYGREEKAHVEKEYFYLAGDGKRQKTDSEYGDDFVRFISDKKEKIKVVFVDPAAASFKTELQRRGFYVRNADNSVIEGIRVVSSMFFTGALTISPECKNTINECYIYSWDTSLSGVEKPKKINDDCMDCLRYNVYSYLGNLGKYKTRTQGSVL